MKSKLICTGVLTFTQRILTLLREQKEIEQEIILMDGSKQFEKGRVKVKLHFKANNFETKVFRRKKQNKV